MDEPSVPLVISIILGVMAAAVILGLLTRRNVRGPRAQLIGMGLVGRQLAPYTLWDLAEPWAGATKVALIERDHGFDLYRADAGWITEPSTADYVGRIHGHVGDPDAAIRAFGYSPKG